jgi:YD repeat-containing protein
MSAGPIVSYRLSNLEGTIGRLRHSVDAASTTRLGAVSGGDRDAAYRLVTSHLRLAAKLALRYRGYGLPVAARKTHQRL